MTGRTVVAEEAFRPGHQSCHEVCMMQMTDDSRPAVSRAELHHHARALRSAFFLLSSNMVIRAQMSWRSASA